MQFFNGWEEKRDVWHAYIYVFPHLLKTYFGFTSKFEKNRENRNFSFKNIMYKTLFFSVLMMYLLNALFESKESKEVVNVEHFFYKLLVGYMFIRIYISLLRTSFNCKCKCEKVSKKVL